MINDTIINIQVVHVRTLYAMLFNVVFSVMRLFEEEEEYCFIIYVDRLVGLSVCPSVDKRVSDHYIVNQGFHI